MLIYIALIIMFIEYCEYGVLTILFIIYLAFLFVNSFKTISFICMRQEIFMGSMRRYYTLPVCITARAHTFAFEFDPVMNFMATLIARFMRPTWGPSGADRTQVGPMLAPWTLLSGHFNNKLAEVSTGEKTYDTTVYKVWKHVAWSKHEVQLWEYVEQPTGRRLFAWHFLSSFKQR